MAMARRKAAPPPADMRGPPHDGRRNGCHNWRNQPRSGEDSMTAIARILSAAGIAALSVVSITSTALAAWPERNITLIACFPAGGGTDIAARLIATPLGEALGTTVIVENRGGAGGNIGTAVAARAAPDGYTFLICSSAFVVNPSLYAKVTYDPFKDFAPIMVLGASPNVLTVPGQSDIKTMPELIARAKA